MTPYDTSQDAALARRAAAGDEQAFTELVRQNKEQLYRLLRRYTGNADEAYEAVQEAFIAAWSAIGRYDPERPFQAWLRRIALKKARDRSRRIAVRNALFRVGDHSDKDTLAHPDRVPLADQAMMDLQDIAALDRAVARLPAALKAALLLVAIEGCSHREAGEILGVSTKAIEVRIYRARVILKRSLDPDAFRRNRSERISVKLFN